MEPLLLPWLVARKRKLRDESEKAVIPRKRFHVAPQFRIIYYDAKGPVEMSRMILAYSGIPFDDVRLKTEDEWSKAKKQSPNLALPILEWNSKKLCDPDAIARMLANMYGLGGNGIFEQAQADAMLGIMNDLKTTIFDYMKLRLLNHPLKKEITDFKIDFEIKPNTMEKMYIQVFEPAIKKYIGLLEQFASQRHGFFLSSGVSYVDFQMAFFYEILNAVHPELMTKYTNIRNIVERVSALPQLQIYLSQRKKTNW